MLARMCSLPAGHMMVADAISMLRLRFGEPVRFKFIVGELDIDAFYIVHLNQF